MINDFLRYQKGLSMEHLFPKLDDRKCSCGCGLVLLSRQRKWFSKECTNKSLIQFLIIKGDPVIIRSELFKAQQGYCVMCGIYDDKWQADHIIAVCNGGGGKGMENYQTLCEHCHKQKTIFDLSQQKETINSSK